MTITRLGGNVASFVYTSKGAHAHTLIDHTHTVFSPPEISGLETTKLHTEVHTWVNISLVPRPFELGP